MENMVNLGYDVTETNPMTCNVWTDPLATSDEVHKKLIAHSHDLELYTKAVQNFKSVPDLLQGLKGNSDICRSLALHPDGIQGIFPSNQLSYSTSGYIEPLLPPMRHHKMCLSQANVKMSLDYLVHDFEAMCRKLKPTSRRILIDMGASLDFHGNNQPIVTLLNLYAKFGFNFDHIYAFEKTPKDPVELYTNRLPEKYFTAYHWINIGVNAQEGHKLNPLHSILKQFDVDDFIVVKLDIDMKSIEASLAMQLLEDKDQIYSRLVDQFYYEDHVHLGDMEKSWDTYMKGSIKDSFDLFYGLRKKGIPAHFWP